MRPNKLRELLKANKPTLSTHIHTTWPSVVEAIGHTGLYDYVEFVGEYGPYFVSFGQPELTPLRLRWSLAASIRFLSHRDATRASFARQPRARNS